METVKPEKAILLDAMEIIAKQQDQIQRQSELIAKLFEILERTLKTA